MSGGPRQIDCREAADLLYEYLDGELTPEREAEVRHHLDQCANCFQLSKFEDAYLRFLEVRSRARKAPEHLRKQILNQLLFGEQKGTPETS
jgi:anti-sigma factor (TIGR02949 family)